MRIATRLFLTTLPGIAGILAIAALAYSRQSGNQSSDVAAVALVAIVVSLAFAWRNVRYIAMYPGLRDDVSMGVESRDIHHGTLPDAASMTGGDTLGRLDEVRSHSADCASLLCEVSDRVAEHLQEAELPLHVLLSSPFGSLNENQEELLSAAQTAVADASDEIRRLTKLIQLDRDDIHPVLQPIGLAGLLGPAVAIASAHARRARVRFDASIPGTLPRVLVDPMVAQEALTTLFRWAVARGSSNGGARMSAQELKPGTIRITVSHAAPPELDTVPIEIRIAGRLITIHRGAMTIAPDCVMVDLPAEEIASACHPQ